MANDPRIAVEISAVDQFTSTLSRFSKEVTSVTSVTDRLGGKLNENMTRVTMPSLGLSGAAKEMERFHTRSLARVAGISRLVPGLGALGGLASFAGNREAVAHYADRGVTLGSPLPAMEA